MKKLLLITVTMIMISSKPMAQDNIPGQKDYLNEFQKQVVIPSGYHFYSVKKVVADNESALLFRYQKDRNENKNGEHFSFIISENEKQILGFTYMDKKFSNSKMISKAEAKKITETFLRQLDNSLAKELKNLWIEQHDEQIIANDKEAIISGIKYKCYRAATNDYCWVVVGFDGAIVTFERNIKWDNTAGKRITEKWLHDSWVIEKDKIDVSSEQEVLKTLLETTFLNGALNDLNTEQMSNGFHPDFAILIADNTNLKRLELPVWIKIVEEYKNDAKKVKSGDRNLEYKFDLIDVTGNAAVVKTQLFRKGEHVITDYISLLKFENGWQAVAKVSNEHIQNPLKM